MPKKCVFTVGPKNDVSEEFNTLKEALNYVEECIEADFTDEYDDPYDFTEFEIKNYLDTYYNINKVESTKINLDMEILLKKIRESVKEFIDENKQKEKDKEYKQYLKLRKRFESK